MGIDKVKDRRGRRYIGKYWPNGSGQRMYAPNYRSAQALQTRIEASILERRSLVPHLETG